MQFKANMSAVPDGMEWNQGPLLQPDWCAHTHMHCDMLLGVAS